MYKYEFVEATTQGVLLRQENYKEIINEYAKKGWRFVYAVPHLHYNLNQIDKLDLVFEKEVEDFE